VNPRVTSMLASDLVSRREQALRADGLCYHVARQRRRTAPTSMLRSTRKWVGHVLVNGGRALVETGVRVAGEHGATIVAP
jgi:hypothetical protein